MKFVIPSLGRSSMINEKTLQVLKNYNINKQDIYVFVIKEEYDSYRNKIDKDINIIIGKKGISEQRSFISNYFNNNEKIVSLDDDITKILELKENKLVQIESLKELSEKAFDLLEGNGMIGIYPTANPFYMSETLSNDLKFCIGQLRWFYNTQEIESKRTYTLLEDYEVSLLYCLEKKCLRFNNICVKADYNKLCGGLKNVVNRDFKAKQEEVNRFYEQYKKYCFISDRETKTGRKIDIRFKSKIKL